MTRSRKPDNRLVSTVILFFALALLGNVTQADDQTRAENALADLLFERDIENVSYSVRSDGFVDILFGPNVSQEDDWATVKAIKAHPDIDGVLPGRGVSDFCPLP